MQDVDSDDLVSARIKVLLAPEEIEYLTFSADMDAITERASSLASHFDQLRVAIEPAYLYL